MLVTFMIMMSMTMMTMMSMTIITVLMMMIPPRLPCRSQSLGKVAKNRLNVQILLEHHRHGEDVVDDDLDDVVDDDHEDILDYLHLG